MATRRRRGPPPSLIERLEDALRWAGGHPDFAPGGRARRGWMRVAAPALRAVDRLRAPLP